MGSEYIHISSDDSLLTQKNLLETQLNTLFSVKKLRAYRTLRQEELMDKLELKKILDEAKQEIEILLKNIPAQSPMEKAGETDDTQKENPTENEYRLDEELDAIKAKLASLQ
jgi:hypothetical protein